MRTHERSWIAAAALVILASWVGAKETPKPKILVIVSSARALSLREAKSYPTGYFLNELAVPVRKLVEHGYEVVFADPAGNIPALDEHSDSAAYFQNDQAVYKSYRGFLKGLRGLQRPKKLSAVVREGLDRYAAVFVPGGHAPLEDLDRDPDVARILHHFHQAGKPTALICHGPIALIAAVKDPAAFIGALERGEAREASRLAAGWPYAGYRMTIFSTAEEQAAEAGQLGGKVRFYPEEALRAAGGKVEVAQPWTSRVVRDRELITGQNPNSDGQLAEELVKALALAAPKKSPGGSSASAGRP